MTIEKMIEKYTNFIHSEKDFQKQELYKEIIKDLEKVSKHIERSKNWVIPNGCEFCNDLVHIEPASYFGYDKTNEKEKNFFEKAIKDKKFIWIDYTDSGKTYYAVDKCPVCGHIFTEEDYDSYD